LTLAFYDENPETNIALHEATAGKAEVTVCLGAPDPDLTDDQRAVLGLLEWAEDEKRDDVAPQFSVKHARPNGAYYRVSLWLLFPQGDPLEGAGTDPDLMKACELAFKSLEEATRERAETQP
jgi:hypothetical protein